MNRIVFYTVILLQLFACTMFAQAQVNEVKTFSLQEAQDYALEYNAQIKNAEIDIEIADKAIWQTTAIGLPQISGSASYQNMLEIPTQLMPDFITGAVVGVNQGLFGLDPIGPLPESTFFPVQFGSKHNADFSISASQLIFSGEYIVGLQASKTYKQLSEKAYKKTKEELVAGIQQAYYLALVADENVRIMHESQKNLNKTLEEMEEMLRVGFIEDTEVDQIQYLATNMKNQLSSAERMAANTYQLLKLQMGLDVFQQVVLTDPLEVILKKLDVNELVVEPYEVNQNTDFQMLLTQEALNQLSVKREQSTFLPSIAAFATYKENAQRNDFDIFESGKDWYPTKIVGISIDIPIFTSGSRYSKVQEAKLELEKTRNLKQQLEQSVQIEVQQAKNDLMSSYETYLNEKKNLALSQKIYDKTLLKQKEGVSSTLELTTAHNQLLESQGSYIMSIMTLLNNKVALEKLMGNN